MSPSDRAMRAAKRRGRAGLVAPFLIALFAPAAFSQTAAGPQTGPDETLAAITPTAEAVSVGLAGEDPADIARYLLARGAGPAALSPDGKTIAFIFDVTGKRQLWRMPAGGGQPTQLTFGNGVTFFRWVPDGASLVYGADNNGDEQESYYRIAADGSSETLLLPAVAGGFRTFGDIAANGQSFAFASTERNGLDFDLYTADMETGEATRVFDGTYGFYAESLSPDGKSLIVGESVGEDADNLYRLDLASGTLATLSKPDIAERANHTGGGVVWSRDGTRFYYASSKGREFTALYARDVATGDETLIAEADFDIGGLELCGRSGNFISYTINENGFDRLVVRNLKTGKNIDLPTLPEGAVSVSCASQTDDMLVRVNGWATPGDLYRINLKKGDARRVFASDLAGLDPARLVRPESVTMTARDGVTLQGMLYLPDAASKRSDGPPPVLFRVHGGPSGQSGATFDAVTQYHVDRGVAVFEPNVRGSTGFGRTYSALDDREKRLDSVRDLIDMLEALGRDGRVDATRAAVSGGSYGGYMVNAVLAAYPDAFKVGVSLFSVADWVTALEIASPALKASDRIEFGPIDDPEWRAFYTEYSPIRQAQNIRVPVLFSHGVKDPRIDIAETETMVKALRANGIEAPYIRIPDEGHGWRKLSNQLFYYRREAAFIEEHLSAAAD